MSKEKRRFEIEDRMDEVFTGGGGSRTIQMPEGLESFKPKKSGTFRADVVAFQVTDAVKKFHPELRFSPPGKWHWNVIYYAHFGVGPDSQTVICSQKTFGKPCPICQERVKLMKDPHEKEAADAIRPKERQLILLSIRDDRGNSEAPRLWDVATYNFKKQLDFALDNSDADEYEERRQFWHPEHGMTLKIAGSEENSGSGRTYGKYSVLEFKPRKEPLPDEFFELGIDLYALVRETPYETARQLYHGIADEDADDKPTVSKREEKKEDAPKPAPRPGGAIARAGAGQATNGNGSHAKTEPAKVREAEHLGDDVQKVRVKKNGEVGIVLSRNLDKGLVKVKFEGRDVPVIYDNEEVEPADDDNDWVEKGRETSPAKKGKWDDE
jgi:hypothetical protein